MTVTITPITDHEQYNVNEKIIYKNPLFGWMAQTELTDKEKQAFKVYIEVVIDNPRLTTHTRAIYKG